MAIKRIKEEEGKITLEIDNGDFEALKSIEQNYNFSSKENLLRFAIAVLLKSNKKGVYVEEDNGTKNKLVPTDLLIKKTEPTA